MKVCRGVSRRGTSLPWAAASWSSKRGWAGVVGAEEPSPAGRSPARDGVVVSVRLVTVGALISGDGVLFGQPADRSASDITMANDRYRVCPRDSH